jgi:hypothetical protein
MAAYQWQVELQGEDSDLKHLSRNGNSSTFRVIRDHRSQHYMYESELLADCQTPQEVLAVTKECLNALSGALKFTRNSPRPISASAVFRSGDSGERTTFVSLNEAVICRSEATVEVLITDSLGNCIIGPDGASREIAIAKLALHDNAVAKVMRLLCAADEKTWVGMYRIHEVIEDDLGGERAMKTLSWNRERERELFKRCANSVAIAGDSARHGKEVTTPPIDAMSEDSASAYLRHVIEQWLVSKGV